MDSKQLKDTDIDEFFEIQAGIVFFLKQIAIQLAELNEHLQKVDESVFGVKQ
jgi:hypothetical protein